MTMKSVIRISPPYNIVKKNVWKKWVKLKYYPLFLSSPTSGMKVGEKRRDKLKFNEKLHSLLTLICVVYSYIYIYKLKEFNVET